MLADSDLSDRDDATASCLDQRAMTSVVTTLNYSEDELRHLLHDAGFVIENTSAGQARGLVEKVEPWLLIKSRRPDDLLI